MTAAQKNRLDRLGFLAREAAKIERALDRQLASAHGAGFSLRTLETATGIPRATIARRIEAQR